MTKYNRIQNLNSTFVNLILNFFYNYQICKSSCGESLYLKNTGKIKNLYVHVVWKFSIYVSVIENMGKQTKNEINLYKKTFTGPFGGFPKMRQFFQLNFFCIRSMKSRQNQHVNFFWLTSEKSSVNFYHKVYCCHESQLWKNQYFSELSVIEHSK